MTQQPRVHEPSIQFTGDDWFLDGSLLASDGQPLSLLDEQLEWVLYDKGGLNQVISPATVTIALIDAPNGLVQVRVPSEITARLGGGRCYDALRTTDTQGRTRTLWTGVIWVERTGFVAAAPTLQAQSVLIGGSGLWADGIVV